MNLAPPPLFAASAVHATRRADGTTLLQSPQPLGPYARCLSEHLEHWAQLAPERSFLAERDPAAIGWRHLSYAEALRRVRRLAAGLLREGASNTRPVALLSDNGIEHALLTLAAMHVGVPAAAISPAYSLMSGDHAKLRAIVALVAPRLVYADDLARYAGALAAVRGSHKDALIVGRTGHGAPGTKPLAALESEDDEHTVDAARAAVGPDTIAKLLFTSGSTGEPKGVINTQRMLCSNQQARAQTWPFLAAMPPVTVDWLPWSHTFGANHNFNLILRNGGTLYIDGGRPAPGLIDVTIRNLREISPTIYFNVPRGYDMLVAALQADEALRKSFFARLQVILYAAAALPQNLWDALQELAVHTVGAPVPLVSAWGSTETAPLATDCHFQAERAGVIGIPVPGCELKLVPSGEKLEVRVRGPNVSPGYWRRPEITAQSFDDEGFYRIGDAVRFVDAERPEAGLLFDGRVSEDFKLDSGTWVNVGMLRVRAIAALAPLAQDIVLTGHDRAEVGFLIFPNVAACRALCPDLDAATSLPTLLADPRIRAQISRGLQRLRAEGSGSSMHAKRALLLADPPTIDAGEITDKGYINQRAVLARRAALVAALHADPLAAEVIVQP